MSADLNRELETHARIEQDATPTRRTFIGGAAAAGAAVALLRPTAAWAKSPAGLPAQPPAGFVPFSAPGQVVKVKKAGCLEANKPFPEGRRRQGDAAPRARGAHRQGRARRSGEVLRASRRQGVREGQRDRPSEHGDEQGARAPVSRGDDRRGHAAGEHHGARAVSGLHERHAHQRAERPGGRERRLALEQRRHDGLARHPRHPAAHEVRARAHRVDGAHQLRAHQRPLDLRVHRRAEEHDARLQRQPARLPRPPREPADRDPLGAGRLAVAPPPLHHTTASS